MARKHVHFVLPLLLLVGAAAPAQADQILVVEPTDCMLECTPLQEGAVALGVDEALVQAMANSTECRLAVHVIIENVRHHGAVVEVQECLGGVVLHIEGQEGLYAMTSTKANTGDSEGGSCSSIYLGNLLNQIRDPDDAVFNSIEIDLSDCLGKRSFWNITKSNVTSLSETPE